MARAFAEIAFTPSVRAEQARMGSAEAYGGFLDPDADARDRLGPDEAAFLRQRDGFYLSTVTAGGWPYVQFRGGPRGFLKVLDETSLAYADFRGNRQYLSVGNLADNDRIAIIAMDYPNRRRLKLWGRARSVGVDDDRELVEALHDPSYRARPERAVVISVAALDWNCPAHIPQRFTIEEFDAGVNGLMQENERLREENRRLREAAAG